MKKFLLQPLSLLMALLVCAPNCAFGQNEEDVLRYSDITPGGTARSWALGGAFGAVGGDASSASTNPAGFGLYNTSEISFTPQFEVNGAKDTYYGNTTADNDNRFSFGNLSLILSYPNDKGSDWRSGVFGISFDRQASYYQDQHAVAMDVPSTILDQFVNEANGTPPSSLSDLYPFTSNLAYQTYGMDPLDTMSNSYVSAIPSGSSVGQDHTISTSGRLNTTSFFYAANYLDKLYIGASLGLTGVRYDQKTVHREYTDASVDLKDLAYTENLATNGSGIDLKFGVIGRATDNLRLGFSFHSPTWLQLSDAYSYSMTTGFRSSVGGVSSYAQTSPDGSYNYRIRTPWSLLASAAYVAGKHGLVSVDYEYKDFRQAKLNSSSGITDNYDFSMENGAINADFRATSSIRLGTEWRSGGWYFRGGWGIWPDAYTDNDPRHGTSYMRYTAGVGFRNQHVSIDLTGVYGTRNTNYFQYDPSLVDATQARLTDTRGMVTFAYRP
ncbi:MAG: hypothetical protein ABI373_02810 [Flavobacteriales bacterium]